MEKFPRRLLTDDETVIEEFHPHWRTLLPAFALLVVTVAVATTWHGPAAVELRWLMAAVTAAVAVWRGVRWVSTLYVLTSERLIWRWGVLRREGVEIPLEQINTVAFSQTLLERMLGFGDLVVESAGANGESRFIDIPDPQGFQSRVYAVRDSRKKMIYGRSDDSETAPSLSSVQQVWSQVERLAVLRSDGILTQAEFDRAKRELLGD